MTKRSPILGYNHNVRYRGLLFHVQTEDSGVLSPHLFTHLFHQGVIVSTRKLVYDAGSAEETIKSLMQAQHKAVLKDLRRGHFDDKIDAYLGGTPGLLPRDAQDAAGSGDKLARASQPVMPPHVPDDAEAQGREVVLAGPPTEQSLPSIIDEVSAPVLIEQPRPVDAPAPARTYSPQGVPPRVMTAERVSPAGRQQSDLNITIKTPVPAFDSSPEIEIRLELEDDEELDARERARDTDVQAPALDAHTRPTVGYVNDDAARAKALLDGMARGSRPDTVQTPETKRPTGERASVGAAALPPARPISRPPSRQAITPPQVVSRPVTSDDRSRRESDSIEVYSPAPPSAELPQAERPGQYMQNKKISQRIPVDVIKNERGSAPIPSGLARPQQRSLTPVPRPATTPPQTKPVATKPPPAATSIPIPHAPPQQRPATEPARPRTLTPTRTSPGPQPSRTASSNNTGVVMTRPAVIVGAPAKPVSSTQRIRKAREEEGRGFGQGLISEKSLDEVILAYLSEDAEDK